VPLCPAGVRRADLHYKTGIVVPGLAAGHQTALHDGLRDAERAVLPHLGELFVLADQAGLLPDPDLAAARMRALLTVAGL